MQLIHFQNLLSHIVKNVHHQLFYLFAVFSVSPFCQTNNIYKIKGVLENMQRRKRGKRIKQKKIF